MAVDYGNKSKTTSAPVDTSTTAVVDSVQAVEFAESDVMPDPRPTIEDVFLALLTAQTTFAGGNKYWVVEKNVRGNVARLKTLAKQIVKAY